MRPRHFALACLIYISCVLSACSGSGSKPKAGQPAAASEEPQLTEITWLTREHAFGEIEEGTEISHNYMLVNSGQAPLIIHSANATCGCTVPEWPKTPIAAGDTAKIVVTFDSKSRTGTQIKSINITANTAPSLHVLTLRGEVRAKK